MSMFNTNLSNLGCRHCRYYQQEGRRGGKCQKLDVAVRGIWPVCSISLPPFAPSWEEIAESRRKQSQILEGESIRQGIPPPGNCSQPSY